MTSTKLINIVPVLPSSDIARDIIWYQKNVGFETVFSNEMYAVIQRDQQYIHLQWHAGTQDDPLIAGSVIRIQVDSIQPIFNEFLNKEIIPKEKLQLNTPWNTHEFGFFDLNRNGIFMVESLD